MVTEIATKSVYEALKSPNLRLYVVNEFFMTPSAELADYVLPAATWLERPDIWAFSDYGSYIWAREAVVPHIVPAATSTCGTMTSGANWGFRLGQEADWPWETLEEVLDYRLAPLGYTLKTFPRVILRPWKRKVRETGLRHNNRESRVALHRARSVGYDPLPSTLFPRKARRATRACQRVPVHSAYRPEDPVLLPCRVASS